MNFLKPQTSNLEPRWGFTLIEILIVMGILVLVFGFAVASGLDFYGSQSLVAERDVVVNLLRTARGSALENINQSDQGVFIDSTQYVLFEGSSYASRNQSLDAIYPRSKGVTITGPGEIVFTALEGRSNVSGTISIASGNGNANVSVNSEGRVNW